MSGIHIDFGSLGLVTLVTVLATAFILLITASAARMLECVFGWRQPARLVHNMGAENPPPDRSTLAGHRAHRGGRA